MNFTAFFKAMRYVLLNPQQALISLTETIRRHRVLLKKIFMRVNITALIIVIGLVQASAATFAQKISLNEKNASLAKVISSIEQQSGYVFFYDNKDLAQETVTVQLKDASINEILDECFKTLPLTYKIANKTIVLSKIEPTLLDKLKSALSISTTITGTVLDEQNKPLPGVTVIIKGTSTGTVTDEKGKFSIAIANKDVVLTFSFIGYDAQDIKVDNKSVINITMVSGAKALNELVVVGYGSQKKVNLTGSVSTVNAEQLENRPVTGVANALEGTMAGVTVQPVSGQPGGDQGAITIRGTGTLNGGASPLVVIDGVNATTGDLGSINPEDIDNISVLKDAASASIYGNRAANGVIIVTTKKGKKGTAQVTYSDYFGKQKATALPDFLPSWQAATLFNQAQVNEGQTPTYSDADIQKFKNGSDPINYPNTDWLGLLYQGSGFQQNHYLGVNGGTDKTQYAFSLGYFDQDGIIQKTNTQRYTSRLNITTKINDRLSAYADLSYTYQPVTEPQNPYGSFGQMISEINRISPILPLKNSQGEYVKDLDGSPIAWLNSPSFQNDDYYTLSGIAGIDWEIVKGLHLSPSLGYKLNLYQGNVFQSSLTYYNLDGSVSGSPTTSSASDYYTNTTDVTPQVLLNYGIKLGNHNIHALAGYSQEHIGYYALDGYGQNFINNDLSALDLLPQSQTHASSNANELAYRSVFGRVNYDYKGKYLFEGDIRDDGSSRFAPAHQWGVFPGASAGWRVSEEDFFTPLKSVVYNLKLRGSWGRLGNQSIGSNYPAISTLSTGGQSYAFGGTPVPGQAAVVPANPDLIWETTTTTDIGLDADLLKDKLSFTADYFVKKTTGLITQVPVAATYGNEANEPFVNDAGVQNKGWEFVLTYRDKVGDFAYNIAANTSFVQNKVTSLGGGAPEIGSGTITAVGLPINSFYGYQSLGIFQTQAQVNSAPSQSGISPHTAPGDLIYKDVNGDGKIDANDRVYLGNNFPKVTFGLNLNASYKSFDFTAFFQGAAGVKNTLGDNILGQISTSNGKPTAALLDSWTPTNTSAAYPRVLIDYSENNPASNPSSFWIRNASYVRLKNLQVGYTLPQQWANAIHIKKLRVYYSGQNLLTFTQFYKWVDPEIPMGEDGSTYPQVKVNSIGLSATF
jgi:TonB-linked SusC/RagA family outer membrane protein